MTARLKHSPKNRTTAMVPASHGQSRRFERLGNASAGWVAVARRARDFAFASAAFRADVAASCALAAIALPTDFNSPFASPRTPPCGGGGGAAGLGPGVRGNGPLMEPACAAGGCGGMLACGAAGKSPRTELAGAQRSGPFLQDHGGQLHATGRGKLPELHCGERAESLLPIGVVPVLHHGLSLHGLMSHPPTSSDPIR